MEIRLGLMKDKEALIEMAMENQKELLHGNISINLERVEHALHGLFELNKGTHVLFVAETWDGRLTGGLLGCVERYYYSDELQAQLIGNVPGSGVSY